MCVNSWKNYSIVCKSIRYAKLLKHMIKYAIVCFSNQKYAIVYYPAAYDSTHKVTCWCLPYILF